MTDRTDNTERKSGRVVFDQNGNSTWEWQTATGVFERNISEEQLRDLTPVSLKLVDAPQDRKYEGLWVHDGHRATVTPQRQVVRRFETQIERVSPLRTFLRRLAGAA